MTSLTLKKLRPIKILLVEDNWGDAMLMKIAFGRSKFAAHLNIVTDGEQALSFLKKEGQFAGAVSPDLILLDLNLPRMDGRTLLRRIKAEAEFNNLKIIVLTSSKLDSDVREMTEMQADGYLVKPLDFYGFFHIVGDLSKFVLKAKALPQNLLW